MEKNEERIIEREKGGLSLLLMFFVGWSMGAFMGFLFSTSNKEREYVDKVKELTDKLKGKAKEFGNSMSGRAQQALDRIVKSSAELFERGKTIAEERKKELFDAIDAGKKAIQEELSKVEGPPKGKQEKG